MTQLQHDPRPAALSRRRFVQGSALGAGALAGSARLTACSASPG